MKWQRIQEALRREHAVPPAPPAERFWATFRARVAVDGASAVRPALRFSPRRHLSWAAAALVALTLAVVSLLPPAGRPVASTPRLSGVQEVDVFVPYSSMMIIEDDERGGSILWLAGLDMGNGA